MVLFRVVSGSFLNFTYLHLQRQKVKTLVGKSVYTYRFLMLFRFVKRTNAYCTAGMIWLNPWFVFPATVQSSAEGTNNKIRIVTVFRYHLWPERQLVSSAPFGLDFVPFSRQTCRRSSSGSSKTIGLSLLLLFLALSYRLSPTLGRYNWWSLANFHKTIRQFR